MTVAELTDELRTLREELCRESMLFEHPASYEAGVEDALAAVARIADRETAS